MKVAVIGGGMAAAGVLDALSARLDPADITLICEEATSPEGLTLPFEHGASAKDYAAFYATLRRQHGLSFPPPKTHFGVAAERRGVEGWGDIWRSRGAGGLTRFWGGSALPFTQRDLADWPLSLTELRPYYQRAAEAIGVSGRRDALSDIFEAEHLTRPPMPLPPLFEALADAVTHAPPDPGFRIIAGASRTALDTRPDSASRCRYCGDCMIGCAYGAVFDSKHVVQAPGPNKITGTVRRIGADRRVQVIAAGAEAWLGPFDRVYLCAGAPQSTEIAMRSLRIRDGLTLTDNAVLTFPILSTKIRQRAATTQGYFGLTNLLILCEPTSPEASATMVQVYPAFDHLWRYFTPGPLWGPLQGMGRALREQLMIGRIYLDGALSQRYAARLADDEADIIWSLERRPAQRQDWAPVWSALRRALNHQGFHVPPIPPLAHKTSSHYAGTLPLGGAIAKTNGEIAPGVFACDSAVFPTAPATSPSLTIYALACRIASESL